jgi:serine/threonine protein kinase
MGEPSMVGRGGFGAVLRVGPDPVAVKVVPLELPLESFSEKAGFGEVLALKDLLSRSTSSHVIRYEDAWLEEPCALSDLVQDVLPQTWRRTTVPTATADVGEETSRSVLVREMSQLSARWDSPSVGDPGFLHREESSLCMSADTDGEDGFEWENESAPLSRTTSVDGTPCKQVVRSVPGPTTYPVCLLIQMELFSGEHRSTLSDWIKARTGKPDFVDDRVGAVEIFSQLILTVRQIHRSRLVHLDLKPENIFVEESPNLQVKVGDFGLACQLKQLGVLMRGQCVGTPGYAAPEALDGGGALTDKADIYCCGLVLIELLVQFETAMEKTAVFEAVRNGRQIPAALDKMPKAAALVRSMTEPDPCARMSAEDVSKQLKGLRQEAARRSQRRKG